MKKLDSKDAKVIGDDLGINWNEVELDEFTIGVNVEFEHGTKYPATNVTKNNKMQKQISFFFKMPISSPISFASFKSNFFIFSCFILFINFESR